MDLQLLKIYALSLVGTRYFYGGDDPISGFDCSGLACELMRAAGVVPWNFRSNAQGLFAAVKGVMGPTQPCLGALAFYGKSLSDIDHVAFCLDETTMIEAGGGDATTLTPEVASRQNAFVRLRPIRFRKDFLCAIKSIK
jgi:cell wall-associated NlpC family hydrolase